MTINPKPDFPFFLYFFCTIFTLENFPKKFFNKLFSISLHFSKILFKTMTDVPENAPESCPGTQSEKAGKTSACAGCPNQKACSTGVPQIDPDIDLIKERMAFVKHKILVLSGKGGVGKSSVTTSLAYVMSNLTGNDGKPLNVGVLDIDICGPSQARMFGCENESVHSSEEGWAPVFVKDNLFVMSISFLVESRNDANIPFKWVSLLVLLKKRVLFLRTYFADFSFLSFLMFSSVVPPCLFCGWSLSCSILS
ncbi:unnamed protein product [Meloidogyne enterolobii]|uniref:Uncharacterized protein n=1 Tax=Meloidogyne enterolobii TaxID=390850 RepID=A0ACB0YXW9_MELEN